MSSPLSNASAIRPRRDALPTNMRALIGMLAGGITVNVLMIVFHWSFWSAFRLGLLVAYLPTYLDNAQYAVTPREGSRYWPWLAEHRIWRWLFSYFPTTLTTSYDFLRASRAGGQFVLAVHPHGMLSIDHFCFFSDACGFLSQVMPTPRRDLGASVIFFIPGLRELCLWLGVVDAGAKTAHKVLANGYCMQLFPGGIQEQLATDSRQPKIVAKGRMGFIKLALQYDVPIVPCYVFGEDKLYTSISFGLKARRWLVKAARLGLPLFYGRVDSFGLLPERVPMEAVLGEPLWPKGVNEQSQKAVWQARLQANSTDALRKEKNATSTAIAGAGKDGAKTAAPAVPGPGEFFRGTRMKREVTPEEVAEMHARYVRAMEDIFENHKHKHPRYKDAKLEILSAK